MLSRFRCMVISIACVFPTSVANKPYLHLGAHEFCAGSLPLPAHARRGLQKHEPGFRVVECACTCLCLEPDHRDGHEAVRRDSVAKLAMVVKAPALNRSAAQHRAGVHFAHANSYGVGDTGD